MKYLKYTFCCLLWVLSLILFMNSLYAILYLIMVNFGVCSSVLPLLDNVPNLFCFCFLVLVNSFANEMSLYIFSYHLYNGKHNWYKFFREKEKQQKKQNSLEYRELFKNI